ncbi:hypothetical protein ACB098_11G080600 [Castanea mollissima]
MVFDESKSRGIVLQTLMVLQQTSSLSPNQAQAEINSNVGEYLMKYSLCTPPVQILGFVDTGDDLIWLHQRAPRFDPEKSSTYKNVSCSSSLCLQGSPGSGGNNSICQYSVIPCYNGGTFGAKGSGIAGLGAGAVSLVSQLGSSIEGKFSYCFIPLTSQVGDTTCKLNFSSNAVVSGSGAVSAPLLISVDTDYFYYQKLEAMSSGDSSKSNIIIDSGTTLTILPSELYPNFESAVKDEIDFPTTDDLTGFLTLCFQSSSDNLSVPNITAHFDGADKVVCLAFTNVSDEPDSISIFGNLAQANVLEGYDIVKKTVSFKPTDCTKL